MNKKNTIAKISAEMTDRVGKCGRFEGHIEGEYSDIVNVYSSITEELLKGGITPKHIREVVNSAIKEICGDDEAPKQVDNDKKETANHNEEASKEEDDEIPEEVKAGLVFLHMLGIL